MLTPVLKTNRFHLINPTLYLLNVFFKVNHDRKTRFGKKWYVSTNLVKSGKHIEIHRVLSRIFENQKAKFSKKEKPNKNSREFSSILIS